MRIALGFRAHSGWAAMVAAAGTPDAPSVLDRRQITIADPNLTGSKQPYHAAAQLPIEQAGALVQRAIESSRALARDAIASALRDFASQGQQAARCAVLLASGRVLPGLAAILASHTMIHTAEGELFRDALLWAARDCGLPAIGIREKSLAPALLQRLAPLGKSLGPPWTKDQKYAAAAALMALL
jgi:hypothetical protein